jgi:hypothetical protein
MRKLMSAISIIALAVGAASATAPSWAIYVPSSVNMVPNYTGTTVPFSEGTPTFYVQLNGLLYASNYDSEKTKAWYNMAVQALSTGKKIAIYSDVDRLLTVTSCSDYDGTGCYSKNTTGFYRIIQEMAIQP